MNVVYLTGERYGRDKGVLYLLQETSKSYEVNLERYEEQRKQIQELRLIDNRFMAKVFEDHDCVEEILRIIMAKPNLKVISSSVEHHISNLQGRSIRLDIQAVDGEGKLYNVEVQRDDAGALPKRARYNSALLDANIADPGKNYENLSETYVIFITENDVMECELPLYHIERTVLETGESFNDCAHILYVNSKIQDDTELGHLMHDFYCTDADDMYNRILADRVSYFKENEKGVLSMSMYLDKWSLQDIEKGRKQGMLLSLTTQICRKLRKGKSPEIIAEELEEELEEVTKICSVAKKFAPEYNVEQIFETLQKTVAV